MSRHVLDSGVIWYGSGTTEDPMGYVVNVALCNEIICGRWDTSMLKALAKWALKRLEEEK